MGPEDLEVMSNGQSGNKIERQLNWFRKLQNCYSCGKYLANS